MKLWAGQLNKELELVVNFNTQDADSALNSQYGRPLLHHHIVILMTKLYLIDILISIYFAEDWKELISQDYITLEHCGQTCYAMFVPYMY